MSDKRDGVSEGAIEAVAASWKRRHEMGGVQETAVAPAVAELETAVAELVAALAPFAAFGSLPNFDKLPDDFVISSGSRMAAPQLTASDCKKARAAFTAHCHLARKPQEGGHD